PKFMENRKKAMTAFQKAGVVAMFVPGHKPNQLLGVGGGDDTRPALIPTAALGLEDAQLLERLSETGPVEVELQVQGKILGPAQVTNVVADLPGREKPDEWVIVCAHLDAWDLGSGSEDNGAGVAMVLATARALAALPQPPRRSVRFILWGGEEQGLLGSRAY